MLMNVTRSKMNKTTLKPINNVKIAFQWSRQFMLQINPLAEKWILSWILDPYDQDRKCYCGH
jgi:hypothetical protein